MAKNEDTHFTNPNTFISCINSALKSTINDFETVTGED